MYLLTTEQSNSVHKGKGVNFCDPNEDNSDLIFSLAPHFA